MQALESLMKIPLLPEWARLVLLQLLGIYLILQFVFLILKQLQKPELYSLLMALKTALQRANEALVLPVERPWLSMAASVLECSMMYVFSILFLACFGLFMLLLVLIHDSAPLYKMFICSGSSAFFAVTARYYWVVAEKQRLSLRERWKG